VIAEASRAALRAPLRNAVAASPQHDRHETFDANRIAPDQAERVDGTALALKGYINGSPAWKKIARAPVAGPCRSVPPMLT